MQVEGFFSQAPFKGGQIAADKSHIREETTNQGQRPVLFPLPCAEPSSSVPTAVRCQGAWVAFRAGPVPQHAGFAEF